MTNNDEALEAQATREIGPVLDDAQKFMVIASEEKYQQAGEFLVGLKGALKKVGLLFDGMVAKAKASYDEALAVRGKFKNPLEAAEKQVKSGMQTYTLARNRKIAEDQEVARRAALKLEEDSRISQATNAAASGDHARAEAILNKARPVFIPVAPPPAEPKGVSAKRTKWEIEVFDLMALVKAIADGKADIGLVQPDESNLKAGAKTKGVSEPWPGVRAVEIPVISARG